MLDDDLLDEVSEDDELVEDDLLDEVSEDEVSEDEVSEDEVPDDEVSEDDLLDDEVSEDEVPEDEVPEDGELLEDDGGNISEVLTGDISAIVLLVWLDCLCSIFSTGILDTLGKLSVSSEEDSITIFLLAIILYIMNIIYILVTLY